MTTYHVKIEIIQYSISQHTYEETTFDMYIQEDNEVSANKTGIKLFMEHINSSEYYLNDLLEYDNNYQFFLLHKKEFTEYVSQKNSSINTDSLEEVLKPSSIDDDYKKEVESYMFDFIQDKLEKYISDHIHCEEINLNQIKYNYVCHDEY
jgi:hypothetical protein